MTFLTLFSVPSVNKFLWNIIGFTILHLSEAATGGNLLGEVFLEILQNLQENTCDKVSFLKVSFFAQVSTCLTSKISKEIWQMVIWPENVF